MEWVDTEVIYFCVSWSNDSRGLDSARSFVAQIDCTVWLESKFIFLEMKIMFKTKWTIQIWLQTERRVFSLSDSVYNF